MYNPFTKELYHAVKGGGAFLNGRRLKASRTTVMDQAIVVRAHNSSVTKGVIEVGPRIGRLVRSPFLPDLVRRICGRTPGYRRLVRPSSYRMHRYTGGGNPSSTPSTACQMLLHGALKQCQRRAWCRVASAVTIPAAPPSPPRRCRQPRRGRRPQMTEYSSQRDEEALRMMLDTTGAIAGAARAVRQTGCGAMDLCFLARGSVDAVFGGEFCFSFSPTDPKPPFWLFPIELKRHV